MSDNERPESPDDGDETPSRKRTDATVRVRKTERVRPDSKIRIPTPPKIPSPHDEMDLGMDPGPTVIKGLQPPKTDSRRRSSRRLVEGGTIMQRLGGVPDPVELRHVTGQHEIKSELRQHDGRYVIGQELGRGGMGVVKLVKDLDIGRHVAMKTLNPEDPEAAALIGPLIAEAQTTGQLQHPNIIPVYELGVNVDGEVFYTMKAVSGMTLKDVLRRLRTGDDEFKKVYSERKLLGIFQQICLAMAYAHTSGVVHRDLKPDNVLLGSYGEVLVMDWGIAYVMGRTNDLLSQPGVVVGTPHYMAPEQALGEIHRVGGRTDVFSLGVMLYEILTLETPIMTSNTDLALDEVRSLKAPKRPARSTGKGVPEVLADVCVKAMQPDPAERYADCDDMAARIEDYLTGSAENERRNRMAMEELAIGIQALDRYMELRRTREKLKARIKRREREVHRWDALEQKRSLWDLTDNYDHMELMVTQAFATAVNHFHRVIGLVPGQSQARAALANLHWTRFEEAEEESDEPGMIYFADAVLKYNDNRTGPLRGGSGRVTARSFPEGAEIILHDFSKGVPDTRLETGKSLGPAPVADLDMPMGLYLMVARKEGYRDARQTIFVRPGAERTYLLTLNPWTAHDPLVGRAGELNLLKLNYDRSQAGRQVRRTLVSGSDGMGKNRLMTAFTDWIETLPEYVLFFFAECHEQHMLVPYGAITEALRIRAGVKPTDKADEARKKLEVMIESAVSAGGPSTQKDREVISATAETLSRLPGMAAGELVPIGDSKEARRGYDLALVSLLKLMTRWGGVMFYFQEVEYMDDASLRVLRKADDYLGAAPVYVLGFGSDVGITTGWDEVIKLGPLSASAVHAMLRNLLKGPLPAGLHDYVMARSGGVPWLVADTTRELAESYDLYQAETKWYLKDGLPAPKQVSMIEARSLMVQELPLRLSRALQWAAVIGDIFWVDTLEALGVEDAAECCTVLTEKEFIRTVPNSRYPDTPAYAFRSLLFREIVYGNIMDTDDPARMHKGVADWMRQRFQGDIREVAELARHVELARDEDWAALLYGQLGDSCRDVGCFGIARECYQRALTNTLEQEDRVALEERLKSVKSTTGRTFR